MNRREFMKIIAATGAAAIFDPVDVLVRRAIAAPRYFGLHNFIEAHPEAVFIKRTGVPVKTDSEAKKQEGVDLAGEIFTLRDTPGIPLSHMVAIKPNLTCTGGAGGTADGMGILTDPYFVEGVIEGMTEVGLSGDSMYMREGNWLGDSYCPGEAAISPYMGVAERTGAHILDFPTGRDITQLRLNTLEEGSEVIWKDCPDGVIFRRVGYVAPFNHPDSWLLNISKFKCHAMGMTLCSKNLQGMCVHPHIHFCEGVSGAKSHPAPASGDFQPDLEWHIDELYARHLDDGIPRWDKPGGNGGYWMESWAQRTCDSLSVTDIGLNIIEGIYGRNGNAFMLGPGPGGKAEDFMTNVLVFGKDSFRVDIIGHWLGGHEPGNFGLFHIARERGLSNTVNPAAITVYLWENGAPRLVPLEDFQRTPLVSPYLRRDYGGQGEEEYHLIDEPFNYGPVTAVESMSEGQVNRHTQEKRPEAYVLGQNFPNPFNGSTVIEYYLLKGSPVVLEVYNSSGQRIDVLVNGWQGKGTHMASWNAGEWAAGIYFYRFKTDSFEKIGKMIVAK
ncbi:DUF362 domain-containing protein [Candidatus Poribacteria bacterium]